MIVNDCIESETEDFAISRPILEQGSVTFSLCPVIFSKVTTLERTDALRKSSQRNVVFST